MSLFSQWETPQWEASFAGHAPWPIPATKCPSLFRCLAKCRPMNPCAPVNQMRDIGYRRRHTNEYKRPGRSSKRVKRARSADHTPGTFKTRQTNGVSQETPTARCAISSCRVVLVCGAKLMGL